MRDSRYRNQKGILTMIFTQCFPGVWKLTLGEPDKLTPHGFFGGKAAPALSHRAQVPCPFRPEEITGECRPGGYLVTLPMAQSENLYGFGLQFYSFRQNGKRKTLTTNADPVKDTGDSHAPVPFYVSTACYGVLADTAKNVTFDCGATCRIARKAPPQADGSKPGTTTQALYEEKTRGGQVTIFVPGARGLTLYLFADATVRGVVERCNLFSGGGAMPPIWGLGTLYRCYSPAGQADVEKVIDAIRADEMPISMLGLEPGWHSNAYSCSFKWSPERFPEPQKLLKKAEDNHLKVNLWEQAYVHPTADIYQALIPHSGDFEVWQGLCPDFADPEGSRIYGSQQGKLIDQGIAAVKLDECDGSDYTGHWYFPAFARFPSGLTGEEAKNLYGALVQRTINREFEKRNLRTYSEVRAGWSYGAPMGFVLYSDLYDHADFLHAFLSSTFCGLLWSPEVRQCETAEEVIRRLQMVVFSPLSIINGWMVPMPLWQQFDIEKNLKGEYLPDSTLADACRELLRLRNRLVPYLYTAFAAYCKNGTPPFRALAMDYPDDPACADIDDSYLMGEDLLVAPILTGCTGRDVYLPEGVWYDFWTNRRLEGGQVLHVETENIPVYVRSGCVLPLADGELIEADTVIPLSLRLYGCDSGQTILIEDDRISLNYQKGQQKEIALTVKNGAVVSACPAGYRVEAVTVI